MLRPFLLQHFRNCTVELHIDQLIPTMFTKKLMIWVVTLQCEIEDWKPPIIPHIVEISSLVFRCVRQASLATTQVKQFTLDGALFL